MTKCFNIIVNNKIYLNTEYFYNIIKIENVLRHSKLNSEYYLGLFWNTTSKPFHSISPWIV